LKQVKYKTALPLPIDLRWRSELTAYCHADVGACVYSTLHFYGVAE
jgi:hypothetical protein